MFLQRSFVSVILMGLLAGFFSEPVRSQSKRKSRRAPQVEVRRELVSVPSRNTDNVGQAIISYDDDRDQTLVGASLTLLSDSHEVFADLWVGFLVKGKTTLAPGVVEFRLKTGGPTRTFFKGPAKFDLVADAQNIKLDGVKRKRDSIGGVIEELLTGNTPFAHFQQLANGEQIKVRAGGSVFVLRNEDREGLRDLLKVVSGTSN